MTLEISPAELRKKLDAGDGKIVLIDCREAWEHSTAAIPGSELIPMNTIRCDVKLKDAAKRMDRWRRIAMEATKQTGRAKLMEIAEPVGFDALIADLKNENAVLFSERDGGGFDTVTADKKITAIYGPKGGWDDSELALAAKAGVKIVTLGGRILRAETASIAITAILQHCFGDLD